ncbi:dTDP-4-dehydrorhamnose 3,5-epimerase [Streptomyces sp. BE308]|uniref:dTDP-4-dehydrorhamnose 3,5-epimerase family protein n=1 Tax=unclassified Streptomyces TaxID=2593676 RepID=UPI002DD7F88A|nr:MULTISPECIES: dTDP-4-dehydrorhamnose 3,5-epimerase [unclassified Streptomyces]MEE1790021.1 dTDP-4-dehydrorhamnose 3,5-epimerase [Streptomyces sp. BE308]WRZ75239.1 dTDP-4-dehydrorhamnose 3,5-epimerase [Streptomyces sp. NBC_01237]
MRITELDVPGALLITPTPHLDERGSFFEGFRTDALREVTGRTFTVEQINYSVSRARTLRGIHGVTIPPGQAKYVTCVSGTLLDMVVDLRVGSPTFGRHAVNVLDARAGTAVYVPEGLGHGFLALSDDACICYVLSSRYVPGTQFEIDPLDPELDLPWGLTGAPLLSPKDAGAPSLARALAAGTLPTWQEDIFDVYGGMR